MIFAIIGSNSMPIVLPARCRSRTDAFALGRLPSCTVPGRWNLLRGSSAQRRASTAWPLMRKSFW